MREIREKITALAQAYADQLELYQKIGAVGAQEGELIEQGQLDRLLQALKEKEGLLKRAGEYEQQIRALQEQLVSHFGLSSFSLPQLKLAAPEYYQDDLAALHGVVSELVPVLERLEDQERKNEAALSAYLRRAQAQEAVQRKMAGRAYRKEGS